MTEVALSVILVASVIGVVDADDETFGYDRLRAAVEPGGTARQVHDRLLADVDRFTGSRALEEDRSLVVLRRLDGP